MSIFERFKRRESEERDLAEERRREAMRRAQEDLKERMKRRESGDGEQKELDVVDNSDQTS